MVKAVLGASEWRFLQGPAVDDPLLAQYRPATGLSRTLYFITDGRGRQLMVTDANGTLTDADFEDELKNDWRYAGGTDAANTFNSDRFSTPYLPGLAMFRNRVYDQNTSRWTQEDPIGLAGGTNLYQFNGNNPVAYTDPFGLCPPKDNDPCNLSTGDEYLDDPAIRQGLEDAYKGAPANATYPSYKNEVGGYCFAAGCTALPGTLTATSPGARMGGDLLEYHTHGNSNMRDPRQSDPNKVFDDNPSPPDLRNARDPSRAGLSSYIVTPNSIHKLTPDEKGATNTHCFQRWNNSTAGCQP